MEISSFEDSSLPSSSLSSSLEDSSETERSMTRILLAKFPVLLWAAFRCFFVFPCVGIEPKFAAVAAASEDFHLAAALAFLDKVLSFPCPAFSWDYSFPFTHMLKFSRWRWILVFLNNLFFSFSTLFRPQLFFIIVITLVARITDVVIIWMVVIVGFDPFPRHGFFRNRRLAFWHLRILPDLNCDDKVHAFDLTCYTSEKDETLMNVPGGTDAVYSASNGTTTTCCCFRWRAGLTVAVEAFSVETFGVVAILVWLHWNGHIRWGYYELSNSSSNLWLTILMMVVISSLLGV